MFKKYFYDKNLPFWLFTVSTLILLTVPKLIQDGMFLDGMLYTCVSHNLSNGIGTFWEPVYSASYFNAGSHFFHEHPPLVFGIQSIFFKFFGDSMYVERFYTFLTMCITAFLMKYLWNKIFEKNDGLKSIAWLPILIWITIPSTSWSYSNNMMENSMGIFTLSAVIFIYRTAESEKNKIVLLLLAGLFVFFATMSKGIPGFFPVAVPFIFWIVFRKKTLVKTIIQTLIIISIPALLYFILFKIPQSNESLTFYVTKRLLSRISTNPTVGNRFYILKRLFMELLPQIIFILVIIVINKYRKINLPALSNIKLSSLFFLIGLSATVPMILTLVQRGFYLVPSFPYFALGFSILVAPIVFRFRERVSSNPGKFKAILIVSVILFILATGLSVMQKGKSIRDKDMLYDVHTIGKAIPPESEITVSQDIANNYVLECYFIRYFNISLFVDVPRDYIMVKKVPTPVIPDNFKKLNLDTKLYDLYKVKSDIAE